MKTTRADASAQRPVRLLTVGVLLLITIYGLSSNYQSVVINRVVDAYHLTGGAQGIMSSMINLGSIVGLLSAPALQGRLKQTTLLVYGCALLFGSFVLLGATRIYIAMIGASILTGIAFGWLDTNCNAVMVDLHAENRSVFLGFLHGSFGVGALIAPLLITSLFVVMDWHGVSFVMGAIVAIAGILFLFILWRSGKGTPAAVPQERLSRATVQAFLFRKKNMLMLIAGMFYSVMQSGLLIWIVRYMTLSYNAEALGSAALSAYWVCGTISRFFAPRIRLRPITVFLLGAALSCVFQVIGVVSGNAIVMCVMTGVIGLVSGHCVPMLLSEASAGEAGNSSLIASSFLVSMCAVRIFTPVFMGYLADWTSLSIMMLAPAASGAFAALVGLLVLREGAREKRQASIQPV